MRKDVLATASAVALSTGFACAAQAAAPVFTWTGCYIGVNAGADFGNSKWSDLAFPAPAGVSFGTSGGVFGGQAGCNYQFQNFVIGGEGELWGSSLSGSATLLGAEGATLGFKTKSDMAGDLAVRAGYAFDRVLVFGKVGVAWAHYAFTETVRGYGNYTDTGSGDYSGLLLGLGLEYAIDSHWSVKGEYDYVDYGGKAIPLYTVGGGYDYTANIRNIENIVKAAVNFRF